MAFPVPAHLPRNSLPANIPTQILSRISDASSKSLTASLAAECVHELELNIQQTKSRIYERIHEQLPDFERQYESSVTVQIRLRNLSSNVDTLSHALSNPETGLLPTLLSSLEAHSELAQRASDARVAHDALSYLKRCSDKFEGIRELIHSGDFARAVTSAEELSLMLEKSPQAVKKANIMTEMKGQLFALKNIMQEQLSDAYLRSVQLSSAEFRIFPSVPVRQAQTSISLQEILSSLSDVSLNSHLTSLRRDIIAHFIEFPLQQAVSPDLSSTHDANGTPCICLSIFPLPPSQNSRKSTIRYLKVLFDYLHENLFPTLPPPVAVSFPQSLHKPLSTALLRDVLIASLPSSIVGLPNFLTLLEDAAQFEREYCRTSYTDNVARSEGDIEGWAHGVANHYGRKRRVDLLAAVRKLILSDTDDHVTRVEVSRPPGEKVKSHVPEVIPVQGRIGEDGDGNGWDFDDDLQEPSDDTLANGTSQQNGKATHDETLANAGENEWGFNDTNGGVPAQPNADKTVEDEPDAWGWGDGEGEKDDNDAAADNYGQTSKSNSENGHGSEQPSSLDSEDSAWNSVWDEPTKPTPPSPPLPLQPVYQAKAPKVAKRLERFSAKGKEKGPTSPALSSHSPLSQFTTSPIFPSSTSTSSSHAFSSPGNGSSFSSNTSPQSLHLSPSKTQYIPTKPSALSLASKPREPETYSISGCVVDLIGVVTNVLAEGDAIACSSAFANSHLSPPEASASASTLVLQAAPAALDLYRAVYPVAWASELSRSARALRFANDCAYLHDEIGKFNLPSSMTDAVKEQIRGSLEHTHALSTWWFEEGIERECERILQILAQAEGYVDTGDQERFDACEAAMGEVLGEVRTVAGQWKTILSRTKWLQAIGRVVETSLSRVLADILALPDIPELDSRRLSELCRILNALEGLFFDAEDPEMPSMVLDYVPSWLKFSYLSELLEASIADISYLFDEGALIDFGVDELVRLVRALFADTPLRANTIAKLQRGHPVAFE